MNVGRSLYHGWTTLWSHLIGMRDPGRAMVYVRDRNRLLSYKAASRKGANGAWRPKNKSADNEIAKDWADVTARARDLIRNSAHVSGALEKIVNNVVSTGIVPQAQLRTVRGDEDGDRNRLLETQFRNWAEDDRVRFYELQDLVLRHQYSDGGVLAHYFTDAGLLKDGLVPLRIELLELDHLNTSVHGKLTSGNFAYRGIEYNDFGDPLAYHLYTEHPGDYAVMGSTLGSTLGSRTLFESVRVPADRIVHPFARRRAGQRRGISWIAAVIMRMRDLDEYEDSERIAARLTSAFGFFVETPHPELDPAGLGAPLSGYEGPGAVDGTTGQLPAFVESGRVQALPPGTKINATGFQRPGDQFEPFLRTSLRGASAGMGMSYEAFANAYAEANYSSARSAALEERRGYRRQQWFLNSHFNTPAWKTWNLYRVLSGIVPGVGLDVPVSWQVPGWPWVDPLKDANAAKIELELGLTTRRKLCADRGLDYDEIHEQWQREQDDFTQPNGGESAQ